MDQVSEYPDNWKEIADRIKKMHNYKCERCGHPHQPSEGYTLTVHHLIPDKSLCEDFNLCALCQRCHLSIQAHVKMCQRTFGFFEISDWFKPHLDGYMKWHGSLA